jgi:hypothetical protein
MPCVISRADNGCGDDMEARLAATARTRHLPGVNGPQRGADGDMWSDPSAQLGARPRLRALVAALQLATGVTREERRANDRRRCGGGQSTARSRRDTVQAHVHSTVKGQPEGETQGGVTRARSARGKRNPCAHTGQRAMQKARSGARSLRRDGNDEGEAKRKRRSVGDRESRRWAARPREQSDYNERTSRSNGTRGAASWLQSSETRRAGRQSRENNVHGGASPSAEGE